MMMHLMQRHQAHHHCISRGRPRMSQVTAAARRTSVMIQRAYSGEPFGIERSAAISVAHPPTRVGPRRRSCLAGT
jgi:hypothetical protein